MVYWSHSSVIPAFAVISMESRHIKSSGRLVGRLTGVSRIFLSMGIFNNPSTEAVFYFFASILSNRREENTLFLKARLFK